MTAPPIELVITGLEAAFGYRFEDPALLERALTHSSIQSSPPQPLPPDPSPPEPRSSPPQSSQVPASRVPASRASLPQDDAAAGDFERLEFLGDRVLGLITAESLWRRFPGLPEGELALRLNALVRKETCAKAARFIRLGEFLRLSKSEESAGGRDKTSILGDACEALMGALYIDGGLGAARRFYAHYWDAHFEALSARPKDAKSTLQEWSQERVGSVPVYTSTGRTGPDHNPLFFIQVLVKGYEGVEGEGPSKRAAEMAAARRFLIGHGIWKVQDGN